jgi:hypothetical protein
MSENGATKGKVTEVSYGPYECKEDVMTRERLHVEQIKDAATTTTETSVMPTLQAKLNPI